jgi:carboxyl-terminal processing protease
VQSLVQLRPFMRGQLTLLSSNDPGALKVTIRKFYRASGSSTQLKGVVPDIILPSIYNHAEVGEASLDNPMPWDTIEPAAYEPLNFVPGYVPALRRKAEGRVGTDRDFVYLREEVERYKKTVAEKRVSLNENLRLKEKREADERAKTRKKELVARPEPPGKIYEITLKLADEPGLPPPLVKTNNVKSTLTSTNNPVQAAAEQPNLDPTDPVEESGEAGDDKTPSVDIVLDEARRILLDLVTATQQAPALAERREQTDNGGSTGTTGLGRSKPVKQ